MTYNPLLKMTNAASKRLEMLTQMASDPKADPFVLYGLAMEYRKQQDSEATLKWFSELKEKHPDYLPTYLMAGQVLLELKRNAEAAEWLQLGIQLADKLGDSKALGELEQALDEATS